MDDGNEIVLQKYTWSTPGVPISMTIAEMVLTLSWTLLLEIHANVRMTHSRTIESVIIADKVLALSRPMLFETFGKKYALPTPGPYESMIVAETVLALSWAMLFEIPCKPRCKPYKSLIIAGTVLTLSWAMLFEIVWKRMHYPLHDHWFGWLNSIDKVSIRWEMVSKR